MRVGPLYYRICMTRVGHLAARMALRIARSLGLLREFRTPLDALDLDHAPCAALMALWQRMHWSSGDGMMPPKQLIAIYRLAATWPVRGDVVELGAWVGLTTSYLATACHLRGADVVHAVDTFSGTKEDDSQYPSVRRFGGSTLRAFRDQLDRIGLRGQVHEMIGLTTDAARDYRGDPIRVLLIDADHSYNGVRGDFEAWFPHVAPNGLIIFHDYAMASVARFVDEVRRADPSVADAPGLVAENVYALTKRANVSVAGVHSPVVSTGHMVLST